MTTTRDIPEGERLSRLEAVVESLVREIAELRADLRQSRFGGQAGLHPLDIKEDRKIFWAKRITLGLVFAMWISVLVTIVLRM